LAGYTTTANITAKQLTATNITAANKEYDQLLTAVLTLNTAGLNGVVAGDTVNIVTTSAVGAFTTKTVANNKTVTVSGLSISGTDALNYTLAGYTTTANITAKQLTATNITAANKEYNQLLSATLNDASAGLSGVIDGDTVTIVTTSASGTFANKTVENGKTVTVSGLTLSGTDALNYTLAGYTTTANITAKQLTATNITARDKEYDQLLSASLRLNTAGLSGVISGDTVNIETGSAVGVFGSKTVAEGKTVTINSLSISGADAVNYILPSVMTTTASIVAKQLTATNITAASKEYDQLLTASLTVNGAGLNGVIDGDTVTIVTASAAGAFATKTVGVNKAVTVSGLSITGADSVNYVLASTTVTASITARSLTVSGITAADKIFDGTTSASISVASATLNGILGNDVVVIDTANAVGNFVDEKVGSNKTVRVSAVAVTGVDGPNYVVTQPTTTATIITAVTAWMDYRAESSTSSAEEPVLRLTAPQVLPPAPARVSTRSVSGGRSTRVTAMRAVKDAAIPVTHAIITVLNSRNKVLARINVKVDPSNPTTAVTVPYARRNVRVKVQFANDIGISRGGPSGVNVTQGNTFDWASVNGVPQIRGTEVPGSLIFTRGSSTLTNSMKASLRQTARSVTQQGGLVYVTGFAQNGEIASAWRLESLAQKRAEVVAKYLTSLGVRQWVTYQGHAGVRNPWNTARERRVAISTEPFYG
jgi:flagellar motor protein MotB/endonuclease YncB( thermonuclease family)